MSSEHRQRLEEKYKSKISVNMNLNRQLVSFQANKGLPFFRWFKYKEGFSAPLVDYLIDHSHFRGKRVLLDPFAGSGAALFCAREKGLKAIGIELLPVGIFTVKNRLNAEKVEIQNFSCLAKKIKCMDWLQFRQDGPFKFTHLNITKGAFPEETEKQMNGFLDYCNNGLDDPTMKELLVFSLFSILESISFTRKDGQYLRWDERAKRRHGNPGNFRKEEIVSFKHAMAQKMDELVFDISTMNRDRKEKEDLILYENSILYKLPEFEDNSIDLVVTSPPYCNRYDYTRTYALELAFLGIDDEKLKALRQALLTSTVENQEKLDQLKLFYTAKGRNKIFEQIYEAFSSQAALNEIISVLEDYRSQNKLNNSNIVRMIKNYFFEMCLVIFEMYRVLQKEGVVYMINDNVRYAGETIPVDLILSEFAASAGFIVDKIWILGNGKGNSSQQMGNHGREELRKCLYIWKK